MAGKVRSKLTKRLQEVVSNDAVVEKAVKLLIDITRRATDAGRQLTLASLVTRIHIFILSISKPSGMS